MADVRFNTAEIVKHMKGVAFPTEKDELIESIRGSGASEETIAFLDSDLPDGTYRSTADVMEALGESEE
jgi:hypothetical protein